jgi:hypothetical protein
MTYRTKSVQVEVFRWMKNRDRSKDPAWLTAIFENGTARLFFPPYGAQRLSIDYDDTCFDVHHGEYLLLFPDGHLEKRTSYQFETQFEEAPGSNLPLVTQQPIIHVDATPDEAYPLRILRAYRKHCNCKWAYSDSDNPAIVKMNEDCDRRAQLLDAAIAKLATQTSVSPPCGAARPLPLSTEDRLAALMRETGVTAEIRARPDSIWSVSALMRVGPGSVLAYHCVHGKTADEALSKAERMKGV